MGVMIIIMMATNTGETDQRIVTIHWNMAPNAPPILNNSLTELTHLMYSPQLETTDPIGQEISLVNNPFNK